MTMTEAEWLTCTDPQKMLCLLQEKGRVSDRKVRLFLVASCYRIWDLLPHEHSREAARTVERYSDELASRDELKLAHRSAHTACAELEQAMWKAATEGFQLFDGPSPGTEEEIDAAIQNEALATKLAHASLLPTVAAESDPAFTGHLPLLDYADELVLADWACFLRDIFANPFRSVTLDPCWLTPQAVVLAQAIYEERAFDRLRILADALEEAGCTNAGLLDHCRGPGPHVKGCWLVDLLLGKK
jgi:hypothetical protein